MRLIDADALMKRLVEFCNKNCPYTAKERNVMCSSCFIGLALEAVEDAPIIEERKTGKWILHPEIKNVYGGTVIQCSECGEKYVVQHLEDEKYCRNCGADMRKGEMSE